MAAQLESRVAAVAEDSACAAFAAAEIDDLRFCCLELYGRESCTCVAAVAKWLALAQSTGTPVITLASFNFDRIRTLLRDGRY